MGANCQKTGSDMSKAPVTKTKPDSREPGGTGDARKPEKPKKSFRPFIIQAWCKKCGICVAFCPKQVYRCDDKGVHVDRPQECGCRFCGVHCPSGISVGGMLHRGVS
jgi:2-oxoglutarate ferredoxin oxidoreductase subunit delta